MLDADAGAAQPIATFEGAQLKTMLQPLGGNPKDRLVIADGQSVIATTDLAHVPGAGDARRQVDGGGGLAHAALLIGDREGRHV